MKIAIIADPIDEQYAGIYVYAKEFIEALERANKQHEIVYIHQRRNVFFEGKSELIIPLRREIPLWATFRKFFWIPFILRKFDFDLVHDLSHIAPFTFWGSGYKKAITIHDITPVLFPQWHVKVSTIVHRLIFPFVFRRADLVLTDSEHTKKDILKRYRVHGRVESVLLASRSAMEAKDKRAAHDYLDVKYGIKGDFILYVGTLEPRKNIGFLLDIFEQVKQQGIFQGKLVLVGKQGWFLEQFKERLAQMEKKNRADIILAGFIPEEDLSFFYSAAMVFIYPSYYEGFGLPPLEAMKCGCPTIVANNSSLGEVVEKGGLLIREYDVLIWSQAIKTILSVQAYRHTLIQAGLERADAFCWDKHAQQVLQLYAEV